ncbi:hypothetical protein JOE11_004826 [Robbsia andropogonis]|uniref:Pr6Pr family membrane protein n=1 Tax=Robbsia andropogonis TaxID=28092 RepID=UPI00069647F7|nr:Pr6Pr family membrane protein [Robbsia andropogonis]
MRKPTEPLSSSRYGGNRSAREHLPTGSLVAPSTPANASVDDVANNASAPLPTPPYESNVRLKPGAVGLVTVLAVLSCFGAVGQVTKTMTWFMSQGWSWAESAIRTASYLTNLTIALSAVCFVVVLLAMTPLKRWLPPWSYRASVITAVTLYLAFVGCGYNLLLRGHWAPTGMRAVLNEVVHTIVPILALIYWMLYVPRFTVNARRLWLWLVYPLGYLFCMLWSGSVRDFYPYPFINVERLGIERVLGNALGLVIGFLALMALFLLINHRRRR